MVRGVPEMTNVHEPDKDTNNCDDFSQHVSEIIKLPLQGRLF